MYSLKKASFDIDSRKNLIKLSTKEGSEIYKKTKQAIHEGKHDN